MHFQISLLLICIAAVIKCVPAKNVVVFGGSGAVGSEVVKAVLGEEDFFDEVFLVGRQTSFEKIDKLISSTDEVKATVTRINLARVEDITTDASIARADACIIALGAGAPHLDNLRKWLSVEVDLIRNIAEFCNKVQAKSISLLSAVDVENESAVSFTSDEIASYGEGALGWINMILLYNRVKGLEEKSVLEGAENVRYIRLFQPNTIVTEQPRYGWFDATLFRLHKILDPYLPERYHSVDVELLGKAMVADTKRKLMEHEDIASLQDVATLTYRDYVTVVGDISQERQRDDEL